VYSLKVHETTKSAQWWSAALTNRNNMAAMKIVGERENIESA